MLEKIYTISSTGGNQINCYNIAFDPSVGDHLIINNKYISIIIKTIIVLLVILIALSISVKFLIKTVHAIKLEQRKTPIELRSEQLNNYYKK